MAGIKDLARRLFSGREDEQNMTQMTLAVEGMSCGHCKAAVEGEISKLAGVEHSDADFENNTVEVRYDEGRVTNSDLREAVERAGYEVRG